MPGNWAGACWKWGVGTGDFTRMLLDREAVIAIDIEAACVKRS